MGVNTSVLVYLPAFDMFSRPIIIAPTMSQPGGAAYVNRGIYHSDTTSYLTENQTIVSDQTTTLDIREDEFGVIPAQGDLVSIPQDGSGGMRAVGDFIIVNVWNNGGGEITLQLRKVDQS
jgi:hypothetical protein